MTATRRPSLLRRRIPILAALVLAACSESSTPGDDGGAADSSRIDLVCRTDAQCSDGRFCNGAELCDPEAPGADTRGCLAGASPCAGFRCDEANDVCTSCDDADADGDGHDDIACGGDDCDDLDAQRFPGNPEICDLADRDEDCDPGTVGPDADGDGDPSAQCCNDIAGSLLCGGDCDDDNANIRAGAVEVCNGQDEDCDGSLDEGVPHVIYPDGDGDGFGRSLEGENACTLPPGGGYSFLGGDCDDEDGSLHPGTAEHCNGEDDDCDAAVDEGCPCEPGESRSCGARGPDGELLEAGSCHSGDQICRERRWSSCIMATAPEEERCNRVDDDCDGRIDEGQARLGYVDEDGDGFGHEPRMVCGSLAGYVSRDGDCDDRDAAIAPGRTEVCDGRDQDCNGAVDEGLDDCTTECTTGETRACSTGCGTGEETCELGFWGACVAPGETCNDADDDCDGSVDEDLTRACSTACGAGTETCTAGAFGGCTAPMPADEVCNGADDDCDGTIDGFTRPCSSACGTGTESCSGGSWGACAIDTTTFPCDSPPPPSCDGTGRVVYSGGRCVDAGGTPSCEYDEVRTECATGGDTCFAGACVSPVVQIVGERGFAGTNPFMCARQASGRVTCWGSNANGRLGNGGTADSPSTAVEVLTDAVDISAGAGHACAARRDGRVSCWGLNDQGQLGVTGVASSNVPVDTVPLGGTAIDVYATSQSSCALLSGGNFVCWGSTSWFFGTTAGVRTIATGVTALEEGLSAVYLRYPGRVDFLGNAGWGWPTASHVPQTFSLPDYAAYRTGWDHTCLLRTDGFVDCIGRDQGKSGDGTPADEQHVTPVRVLDLSGAIGLGVSAGISCALLGTGGVECWGPPAALAAPVTGISDATVIGNGWSRFCTGHENGQVRCWTGTTGAPSLIAGLPVP